ncbi:MAG TPA: DUF2279 domain-containing protein [Bacteroidales bacterium]|nr:DUF2279 domain-containing protein [Bacteroidales bacterium]HPS17100.1 DUF2279 domain-containing protein [Bacteroidales bacterium]
MKNFRIFIFLIFALPALGFSNSSGITEDSTFLPKHYTFGDTLQPEKTKKVNKLRLAIVGSSVPILTTGVFIYFQNAWWNDTLQYYGLPKSKFHFDDSKELKYALCLDKCGHFWSSQIASNVFCELLEWAGIQQRKAKWYGAGFAILTSGIVEVKDGMAPWWGFSLTDMGANILGSLYPVLQDYHPFFKNFTFKWSYDFIHKSYFKTFPHNVDKSFMDDYERHTYWLCSNIKGIAPASWKKHIPKFLSFDVGVSAEYLDGHGAGTRQWFLGIGLDLSNINIKNFNFYNNHKHLLNLYRLPSPVQQISPHKVSYLIAF